MELKLEERETVFYINATDRSIVEVFSNDSVVQRQIEKKGFEYVKEESDGGRHYRMPRKCLRIFRDIQVSEEERSRRADRLREWRRTN